jgi:hypothetical protein
MFKNISRIFHHYFDRVRCLIILIMNFIIKIHNYITINDENFIKYFKFLL